MLGVMETLVYPLRELVHIGGRDYEFTIFENETMRLLFWVGRDYAFTIWVGRDYEFTEGQKESGGTRVISSDAAFFWLNR